MVGERGARRSRYGLLAEAKSAVSTGAEVIYLGWIMAGSIKGYAAAARRYRVRAVLDWYSARK